MPAKRKRGVTSAVENTNAETTRTVPDGDSEGGAVAVKEIAQRSPRKQDQLTVDEKPGEDVGTDELDMELESAILEILRARDPGKTC